MKTIYLITLLFGLATSYAQYQVGNVANGFIQESNPMNFPDIIQQLNSGAMVDPVVVAQQVGVPYDQTEGVPSHFTTGVHPDSYYGAYSTREYIITSLEELQYMNSSERLQYFVGDELGGGAIEELLAISGSKSDEVLARVVINRAKDLFDYTLPLVGHNIDYIRSFYNRFFIQSFELALSYLQNGTGLDSLLTSSSHRNNPTDFISRLNMAEFTLEYAQFVFSTSQQLTSNASQAILLARLTSYIVWDLNTDLRRRAPQIQQSLADISRLQRRRTYRGPLMAIDNNVEPTSAQVAQLRSNVDRVVSTLRRRLEEMGLEVSPGDYR